MALVAIAVLGCRANIFAVFLFCNSFWSSISDDMKSLKIQKGQSEAVNDVFTHQKKID